ncbi:MBG domain-containing protein, partial [Marinobacterium lutimaris]
IEQGGAIRADGGKVLLTARAAGKLATSVINHTGITQAQTLATGEKGEIVLLGDMQQGQVQVAGTLDASAPVVDGKGGDGGFIETSAAKVDLKEGVRVTTLAERGKTGEWLIDPTDINITTGASADAVLTNLAFSNLRLDTTSEGADAGNIRIDADLSWDAANTLTLLADNDIAINGDITATNGGLTLNAGGEISAGGAVNVGTFDLQSGDWTQLGGTLPAFSADDFRLSTGNASFLRATAGDGSEGNAYRIFDIYGLQGMASRSLLSSDFTLTSTLDASGTANWNGGAGFVPIGDSSNRYTGDFDGGGHIIYGLTINRAGTDRVGLFGAINGSHIRHIGLQNASILGRYDVGGLVGHGVNAGQISHSYVQGSITGSYRSGGLAGNFSGTIEQSYSTGTVDIGSASYAGGLVGEMVGQITDSYSTATVEGLVDNTGGLVGRMSGNISGSYAAGNVRGGDNVGGLVGDMLAGSNISNSFATGNVNGNGNGWNIGGLAGDSRATISHSYATGNVQGGSYTGGLVGDNYGSITQSYASGDVSGGEGVGGLVGFNFGASINQSYATGRVSGGWYHLGGLVGLNSGGSISQSYATGDVSGTIREIGGLVGLNSGGSISQSYATGRISSSTGVTGALVGGNTGGTLTDNYWNTETSGQAGAVGDGSDDGTTGLTTAQMFDAANFLGFDFADIWANADDQTTPYLRALAGNRVFNKNDLPTGTIDASNRPALYTVILDIDQLQAMQNDLSANYLLGNDIDASATAGWNSGAGFDPLGASDNRFSGLFDGLGYSIDRLTIQRPEQSGVGLFSYTDEDSEIRNLGLTNVDIRGQNFVGSLVGNGYGSLYGVFATGSLAGDFTVGGLAGLSQNSITESYADVDINAISIAGGLAGSQVGDIENSYATGDIQVQVDPSIGSAGGLAGMFDGFINDSYSTVIINDSFARLLGSWLAGGTANAYYANTDENGNALIDGGPLSGGWSKSWAELTQLDTFYAWEPNIDAQGGSGSVWRIYDGYTTPLLRRFLKALEVSAEDTTLTYNGTEQSGNWSASAPYDAEHIYGQPIGGKNAGSYTLDMRGLYSGQQGYDLIITSEPGTLTINKAQATVTANSGSTTYNGANQQVNGFTVDGLVGGEDQSVLNDVSTSGGSGKNAGTYVHTVDGTDGNYELTFVDGALTIDKAQATVTANSRSTTYNGANQNISGFSVDGLVGGEDQSVLNDVSTSGGSGKNAGTYVHTVDGTDGNYELTFVDGALTIDKAQATVTANSRSTTYNGANQNISGFSVDGLVGGEAQSVLTDVSTSGGSGKNAGTYAHTVDGTDGNYELTFVDGALTIDKAQATVTANSGTTTYNGANQQVNGFSVDGLVGGEDQSVLTDVSTTGGSGKNAGTYVHRAAGTDGNYELTFVDGALTIDKAQATVTANSGTTTYNGANQQVNGFSVDGLVGGEDQSVLTDVSTSGGSGKNAGTYVHRAAGTDGNYELTFVDGALTIDKAQATVTANSGTTTYNGANQQVNGFSVDGLVDGEDQSVLSEVSTTGGSGKNAGTYAHTVDGTDGNYELTFVDGALTIDKAQATVTANSGSTTYNGANQQVNGFSVDGLVGGEDQNVLSDVTTSGGSGKNAGTYVHRAAGTDGNYELTFVDGALTIDKAQATVTANSGNTTYNGTNQQVNGFRVDGLVGGEDQSVLSDVTTSGGSGKNAGNYVHTVDGTDSNYELTFVDGALTIDKAQATVTANSGSTIYNGANQQVNGFTVDGLVGGEDQSVLTDVSASGGSGKNAGTYVHRAEGTDGNYELTFVDGALTIDKAQATVTANSGTTTYNGPNQQVNGFSVDGLVGGEDQSVLSDVTTSGGSGKNAGTYVHRAAGTDGNYELTFVDGSLTIDKAQATVTANSGSTTYNGANQQVNGFTVDGLVGGEDQSVLTDVSTSGGSGKNAGTYVHTVDGTDGNYELTLVDGALTIDKAQATVTANSGSTTYNGANQNISGFSVDGLVGGEDQSVLTDVSTSGGSGKNAGTYVHRAEGTDGNYELTFVDGALTIDKAQATVTANSGSTTYNGANQQVNGFTVDGLVGGEDQSVLTDVSTSGGSGKNAGTYVHRAAGTDGNYELTFVDGSLTIDKAQATVTANSGTTTYNGANQQVNGFTVDGLVGGEDQSVLTDVFTTGGSGKNAGTYAHTVDGTDGNYELTFVDGALTIDKAPLIITANNLTWVLDGSAWRGGNGVIYRGFVKEEDASVLTGLLQWGGSSQGATEAGIFSLVPYGLDAANYTLTFNEGMLEIITPMDTVGTPYHRSIQQAQRIPNTKNTAAQDQRETPYTEVRIVDNGIRLP